MCMRRIDVVYDADTKDYEQFEEKHWGKWDGFSEVTLGEDETIRYVDPDGDANNIQK